VVHVLRADVSRGGLDEHGLVEASPNVLRRVNKVLDPTRDAVDSGPGRVRVDDELGGFLEEEKERERMVLEIEETLAEIDWEDFCIRTIESAESMRSR